MRSVTSIPDFSTTRILIVGDIILDNYCYGDINRISPEAPIQVVNVKNEMRKLGGAANVAANIKALGAHPILIGLIGDDAYAQELKDMLLADEIEHYLVQVPDSPTIIKSRIISHSQQLLRIDYEDGFPKAPLSEIAALFNQYLPDVDAVILSDYGKGCLSEIETLIVDAQLAAKSVFVDPKYSDFSRYANATAITPNRHELSLAVGDCHDKDDIAHKGEDLRQSLAVDVLLITRSEEGMTVIEKAKDAIHIPSEKHEVYDVTGAGDTVISVFALAHTAGLSFSQAARLANKAAGEVIMKLGTAVVNIQELAAVHAHAKDRLGIIHIDDLLLQLQSARKKNESIVMTNGCFDLLHRGHLEYLKQAADLGDYLVIAVNDDASVCRLKGASRPITTLADRMSMLAALDFVDWVVAFSEDTPAELIALIKPDILVKGGDYQTEAVVGYDTVVAHGGEIIILDYVEDYSSSALIKKIKTLES